MLDAPGEVSYDVPLRPDSHHNRIAWERRDRLLLLLVPEPI